MRAWLYAPGDGSRPKACVALLLRAQNALLLRAYAPQRQQAALLPAFGAWVDTPRAAENCRCCCRC
jgi:hypothetical protein